MNTLYFKNKKSFLNALDGKVYAICDKRGHFLCDILEDDYIRLTDANILVDLDDDLDYPRIDSDSNILLKIDIDEKSHAEFKEKYGVHIEITSVYNYIEMNNFM